MINDTIYTDFQKYLSIGFDVLPIPPDENGHPTKGPNISAWPTKAANHEFTESDCGQPNTNIGVLLGGSKNLADVDCDDLIAGKIAATFLKEKRPTTTWGRTSKPESHYLYTLDESLPLVQIRDPITKESIIEFRCLKEDGTRGLQTVLPPSIHPSGEAVEFVPGYGLDKLAVGVASEIRDTVRFTGAMTLMAKYWPASEKHYTKRAWARVLCEGGIDEQKAITFITTAYQHAPKRKDPRSKSKDLKDIREVYSEIIKGATNTHLYGVPKLLESYPLKVLDTIIELFDCKRPGRTESYANTDLGNAERFAALHSDKVRYCPQEKEWYVWHGRRWESDKTNSVQELCKQVAASIKQEAETMKPPPASATEEEVEKFTKTQKTLLQWHNRTSMMERLSAMKKAASSRPELIVNKDHFDSDDHLLNCMNGVVDLYTGELMPHEKALFMTKLAPVEYVAGYKHKDWDNVIQTVTRRHPEIAAFIQVFFGYCAQGNKGEELIVNIQGPGGTGKGTTLNPILKTLGDYATTISPDSLLKQDRGGGSASSDIARLEGYRLAVVSELNPGSKLQENFLKMISGNDKIVARKLYSEEREFSPKFQLVFQTNNRPGFNAADTGNRRRYLEVPFDNILANDPQVTRDPHLKKRLADDKDVHKAVLAWIVAGCVEYKKNGLQRPACVEAATEEMFRENDTLGEFFADCLVRDPTGKIPVEVMHRVYEGYCHEAHAKQWDTRTFNKMLKERGLTYGPNRIDGKVSKGWGGATLSEEGESRASQNESVLGKYDRFQHNTNRKLTVEKKTAAAPTPRDMFDEEVA